MSKSSAHRVSAVNTRTFISLDTPRLTLRRFRDSDLASFMAYRNDREIARYQSWESISRAEAAKFIAQQSRHRPGIPGKWFQFAAEAKGRACASAGDCALLVIKDDATPRRNRLHFPRPHFSTADSRLRPHAP